MSCPSPECNVLRVFFDRKTPKRLSDFQSRKARISVSRGSLEPRLDFVCYDHF